MNKYYSKYTERYCHCAQYLTELLMERKYKTLPYKFWNDPKYKKEYIKTIVLLNRFIKKYSEEAVLNTFKMHEDIYSVYYPSFTKFIEIEQKIINGLNKRVEEHEVIKETKSLEVTNLNKIRNIGKLRNLDD